MTTDQINSLQELLDNERKRIEDTQCKEVFWEPTAGLEKAIFDLEDVINQMTSELKILDATNSNTKERQYESTFV